MCVTFGENGVETLWFPNYPNLVQIVRVSHKNKGKNKR